MFMKILNSEIISVFTTMSTILDVSKTSKQNIPRKTISLEDGLRDSVKWYLNIAQS